jgi:tRNA G18 (ribose-2'-O)-methylase SpoU
MTGVDQLVRIDAADDPRIAAYCNIRERDLVGREGRFIAEGHVVLNVLVESGHEIESILLLENRVAGLSALTARLNPDIPVYVTGQAVIDAIAGFHLHRGILAVAKRSPDYPIEILLAGLPEEALVVVLSAISNHDNMGSIFRNAAAFGSDAVVLDDQCCDPLYRKSIRVSVGGALKIPFVKSGDLASICGALSNEGYSLAALSPKGKSTVDRLPSQGKRALVLGSEGAGLPKEILSALPTYRIPMSASFDSLNVATASGIALYHACEGVRTASALPACSS